MSMNEAMRGGQAQFFVSTRPQAGGQYAPYTNIAPCCDFNAPLCFVTDARSRKYPAPNWLQISVHALEVWRYQFVGTTRLFPLSEAEIINAATRPPANPFDEVTGPGQTTADSRLSGPYSVLKARVTLKDNTGQGRVFEADIGGGFRFGFCGVGACVEVLYPDLGRVVQNNQNPAAIAALPDGAIVDTLVEASIGVSPCAPVAAPKLTNSFTRIIDADTNPQDFEIPPGATEVSIFSTNPDPTAIIAEFVQNPFTVGLNPIGRLGPGVLLESSGPFKIPAGARWLRLQAPAGTVTASVVFGVSP